MSKKESAVSRKEMLMGAGVLLGSTVVADRLSAQRGSSAAPADAGKSVKIGIIGGGYGGITAAKHIKRQLPAAEVTLFEQNSMFMSCPMSNHFITGLVELTPLCFPYNSLKVTHGVNFINDVVVGFNAQRKRVSTARNGNFSFDYLIVATGIEYDYEDSPYDREMIMRYPAAFRPGYEHLYLKRILDETEEGELVMTVPEMPHRCPPAPYERAAMIASYFKRNRLPAKVRILDAKSAPPALEEGFLNAYRTLYGDNLIYEPNTTVSSIDLDRKLIRTNKGEVSFMAANLIPPQRAPELLSSAGLLGRGEKWVAIDPITCETRHSGVFVIGDSADHRMPKSGYAAHFQARVVASVLGERIANIGGREQRLNLVCHAMVSDTHSLTMEAIFEEKDGKYEVTRREDNQRRSAGAERYQEWARGLWRDMFH